MLVDSGTTINLFPHSLATAIINAYTPAGKQQGGLVWSIPCNAAPPTLDIVIGGKAIRAHPSNMIVNQPAYEGSTECLSGIGAGQPGSYILGDTFMLPCLMFRIKSRWSLLNGWIKLGFGSRYLTVRLPRYIIYIYLASPCWQKLVVLY
ncbi:hypothetical protein F4815DRAFT_466706, partial [Daldinia loculata]